ncbi:unnamed protein product [Oikopleura dioica]|uniref:Uncharacterized protein n=1 Tax=Oikopleura dioica TaxID=34765 RepID=E4XIV2_OIKDI|nr:unnamed protein product [Oikopleura dioica]
MATPISSKIHVIISTLLILVGMAAIDSFLVKLHEGSRQTGVFVMLLIGNVCLLRWDPNTQSLFIH